MKEIDDKIDYEPGAPEGLAFFKALAFLFLSGVILFFGICIGWSAGWLAAMMFINSFNLTVDWMAFETYPLVSAFAGFLLAAYFPIPRLYRKFYSW